MSRLCTNEQRPQCSFGQRARWNTSAISHVRAYGECDARCSASHFSLIQPGVLAVMTSDTCILGMMTTALNTMTAPTISSIGFRPGATMAPHTLYRLDILRAVLYRTAHDLRGGCSSASRLCPEGTHVLHACACALGNSAVQRRSVHLQHGARIGVACFRRLSDVAVNYLAECPLHRRVMTMPKATPKQQLRRDLIDQRLVAFADHLEIFVGTIRANAASSLDGSELTTELGRIRDRAVDLLAHLARQDTSKRRAPTQPTSATDARRSRGPVDAPGKRHRKPQPQERIDKQMGEPRGKQMGQKHFQAGRRSGRG